MSEPEPQETDLEFDPPGPDWLYRWRSASIGESRLRQSVWRSSSHSSVGDRASRESPCCALPGPGWAAIFLGLAVLATEYVWAHRLLVAPKTGPRRRIGCDEPRSTEPAMSRSRSIVVLLAASLVRGTSTLWLDC